MLDLWMVAAAAGAGYAVKAKHMKSAQSRLTKSSLELFSWDSVHSQVHSRNLLREIRDRTCPLCRLASCKQTATDSLRDIDVTGASSGTNDATQFHHCWNCGNGEFSYMTNEFCRLTASKQVKSQSNGYNFKSFSPLESSLTAELYGDSIRFEEYEYEASPSSYQNMEWLPTISTQIIGASHDFWQEMQLETTKGSSVLTGTPKRSIEINTGLLRRLSRSIERVANEPIFSQGPPSGMRLFFLGLTIGIMSTPAANRTEVDNLRYLLEQNENLVQDLQEELKMKDTLTVKELANEQEPTSFSMNEAAQTTECDGRERDDLEAEDSGAMSKIEAELQAELERLELNMRSSRFGTSFYFDEVDNNFDEDNKVDSKRNELCDSSHDTSGTSTDHIFTANYAVPAKELSLRLHEVIQSRLQTRIIELEEALEITQKKLHTMELDSTIPFEDLPDEVEYLCHQEGPDSTDEGHDIN